MVWYSTPPASRPAPRLTARSMLSLGTEVFFAFWMASYSVGLPAGSPPPVRAATSMFLISFAKGLPRRASITAFLVLVVAHLEWPLMADPSRSGRTARAPVRHPSSRGGTTWPAASPGERRRSYLRRGPPRRGRAPRRRRTPPRPRAPG